MGTWMARWFRTTAPPPADIVLVEDGLMGPARFVASDRQSKRSFPLHHDDYDLVIVRLVVTSKKLSKVAPGASMAGESATCFRWSTTLATQAPLWQTLPVIAQSVVTVAVPSALQAESVSPVHHCPGSGRNL
jgi:hypothetical protein